MVKNAAGGAVVTSWGTFRVGDRVRVDGDVARIVEFGVKDDDAEEFGDRPTASLDNGAWCDVSDLRRA